MVLIESTGGFSGTGVARLELPADPSPPWETREVCPSPERVVCPAPRRDVLPAPDIDLDLALSLILKAAE